MKKKIIKFLLPVIAIIIILTSFFCIETYRYHIDSPMQDVEYKKAILRKSHNITYTLEALRPLMGPQELEKFIKENDNNPTIYNPDYKNLKSGKFRANLHMHTTMSDGAPSVEYRMNYAQDYAQRNIKDGYMIIAITDHNTVLGAKEVIRVLEKNPNKYKNIKIVPGIEINSRYRVSKVIDDHIDIHVLLWAINPYDKFLEKEFYKKDLKDKWNVKRPIKDFDVVINTMADYGLVGIAHPARYTEHLGDKKYPYITELFTKYKNMNGKIKFTEGYYQSYEKTPTASLLGAEYKKYVDYINSEAKRLGIIRTGSTDSHGYTIFKYR